MSETIPQLPVIQDEGHKDKVFEVLLDAVVSMDSYSENSPVTVGD